MLIFFRSEWQWISFTTDKMPVKGKFHKQFNFFWGRGWPFCLGVSLKAHIDKKTVALRQKMRRYRVTRDSLRQKKILVL
jgi:hypothetical protein